MDSMIWMSTIMVGVNCRLNSSSTFKNNLFSRTTNYVEFFNVKERQYFKIFRVINFRGLGQNYSLKVTFLKISTQTKSET